MAQEVPFNGLKKDLSIMDIDNTALLYLFLPKGSSHVHTLYRSKRAPIYELNLTQEGAESSFNADLHYPACLDAVNPHARIALRILGSKKTLSRLSHELVCCPEQSHQEFHRHVLNRLSHSQPGVKHSTIMPFDPFNL
jgi:hypothetical protein